MSLERTLFLFVIRKTLDFWKISVAFSVATVLSVAIKLKRKKKRTCFIRIRSLIVKQIKFNKFRLSLVRNFCFSLITVALNCNKKESVQNVKTKKCTRVVSRGRSYNFFFLFFFFLRKLISRFYLKWKSGEPCRREKKKIKVINGRLEKVLQRYQGCAQQVFALLVRCQLSTNGHTSFLPSNDCLLLEIFSKNSKTASLINAKDVLRFRSCLKGNQTPSTDLKEKKKKVNSSGRSNRKNYDWITSNKKIYND